MDPADILALVIVFCKITGGRDWTEKAAEREVKLIILPISSTTEKRNMIETDEIVTSDEMAMDIWSQAAKTLKGTEEDTIKFPKQTNASKVFSSESMMEITSRTGSVYGR